MRCKKSGFGSSGSEALSLKNLLESLENLGKSDPLNSKFTPELVN